MADTTRKKGIEVVGDTAIDAFRRYLKDRSYDYRQEFKEDSDRAQRELSAAIKRRAQEHLAK